MKQNRSSKKQLRLILRVLGWSFALAVVLAPSVLHSQYGVGISPILSGSMRPFSEPGDAFLTMNTVASTLKVGDIVSLRAEGSDDYYAHRIIEIRYQSGLLRITTKGDANQFAEEDPYLITPDESVPRTVINIKYLGSVLVYVSSLQGRQAALTLIVFANFIGLLYFLFRKKIKHVISDNEKIYKDLFNESNHNVQIERKKAQTYRQLYQDTHQELQLANKER